MDIEDFEFFDTRRGGSLFSEVLYPPISPSVLIVFKTSLVRGLMDADSGNPAALPVPPSLLQPVAAIRVGMLFYDTIVKARLPTRALLIYHSSDHHVGRDLPQLQRLRCLLPFLHDHQRRVPLSSSPRPPLIVPRWKVQGNNAVRNLTFENVPFNRRIYHEIKDMGPSWHFNLMATPPLHLVLIYPTSP